MKTLGIVANVEKQSAAEVLRRLKASAERLGLALRADYPCSALLGLAPRDELKGHQDGIDALVALGGDGTMLRAVRELDGRDKPVIGVNLGSLGFMTSVAESEVERALECLVAGSFTTSLRSILECEARRGTERLGEYRALNDVVLSSLTQRVVTLRLAVDGEEVSDSVCDGLIVSSPTGSTGHSLSAGGPVLMPGAAVFLINLICPHTLSTRPVVVPDGAVIRVTVASSSGSLALSVDGQVGRQLREGDLVEVRRSARCVRLVHPPGYSYFALLRQKLHWRGSNV
jgi:NAD+ kinase